MNIISKDKKEIRWIGLPANSAQVNANKFKNLRQKINKNKTLITHSNVIHWKRRLRRAKSESS